MLRSTGVGTPVPIDFTGFVPITPAEINLRHQLALVPTIDRKFGKVTVMPVAAPGCSTSIPSSSMRGLCSDRRDRGQCHPHGGQLLQRRLGVGRRGAGRRDLRAWPRWFLDCGYTHARSPEFKIRDSASFLQQNGPLASNGVAFPNAGQQIEDGWSRNFEVCLSRRKMA